MMMRQRGLHLAVALLVLATQVAVAIHEPMHAEEAVSACGDPVAHFCTPQESETPEFCVLCRAGSIAAAVETPVALPGLEVQDPVAPPEAGAPVAAPFVPSRAPRAPPIG